MKDEEKKLITNLFNRLKNTELNSSERDAEADVLIQKLVQKQPASSYYMTQTILIQETAIKKMSTKIEELKNKLKEFNSKIKQTKPSFLSNFFKNDNLSPSDTKNNVWKNKEILPQHSNSNSSLSTNASVFANPTTRSSGFLSNALQTAAGVAGGMILGNMLMNVFSHSKPEEEVFDTLNTVSDQNLDDHSLNNDNLSNFENNLEHTSYVENDTDLETLDPSGYSNDNDVMDDDNDVMDDDNDVMDDDNDVMDDDNFV